MNVGDAVNVGEEFERTDSFLTSRSALVQAVDVMSNVSQEDLPQVLNAVGAFYDLEGGFKLKEGY